MSYILLLVTEVNLVIEFEEKREQTDAVRQ